jgi:L,D-peptidoglycan transpeptidase YkuD (ErfK/YbiS/YcfS/YnhG family)
LSIIAVDAAAGRLVFGDIDMLCVIGKGGSCLAPDKREGDGCTPLGNWPVRGVLLRRDRFMLRSMPRIPWRWIRANDGWSDDAADAAYNRPVSLPRSFSAETLLRDDHAYDAIVVLGHNDRPPVPGAGSAIFFHIWVEARPTEGCVAVAAENMLHVVPLLTPATVMRIS